MDRGAARASWQIQETWPGDLDGRARCPRRNRWEPDRQGPVKVFDGDDGIESDADGVAGSPDLFRSTEPPLDRRCSQIEPPRYARGVHAPRDDGVAIVIAVEEGSALFLPRTEQGPMEGPHPRWPRNRCMTEEPYQYVDLDTLEKLPGPRPGRAVRWALFDATRLRANGRFGRTFARGLVPLALQRFLQPLSCQLFKWVS